jgi:hypothetical protein
MKHSIAAICTIAIIFGLVSACLAQEIQSPCNQIEGAIKSKAPMWKVVRKSRFACQKMSYFQLQSGKTFVFVFIFPEKSLEDATNTFKYFASDEEFYGRKVDILGSGWRNPREENRVWKSWSGETGVDLKKGRIVVRVSASTTMLSREFAEYIGDALPDA